MNLIMTLGAVAFPFVAMVYLWRRMKRVRDGACRASQTGLAAEPWTERLKAEGDWGSPATATRMTN